MFIKQLFSKKNKSTSTVVADSAEKEEHNCLHHLDRNCKCRICGQYRHDITSDSNGSGTGMVTARCKRCGGFERYYDDTGTTIESTLSRD